jgi:hypothetical protein
MVDYFFFVVPKVLFNQAAFVTFSILIFTYSWFFVKLGLIFNPDIVSLPTMERITAILREVTSSPR